jgi:hypothetical protein
MRLTVLNHLPIVQCPRCGASGPFITDTLFLRQGPHDYACIKCETGKYKIFEAETPELEDEVLLAVVIMWGPSEAELADVVDFVEPDMDPQERHSLIQSMSKTLAVFRPR